MKKWIFILFILTSLQVTAAEFMLSGGASFNHMNLLGQDQVPTYQGQGFFGDVDYLLPFGHRKAFSFFVHYQTSTLDNIHSESPIKEKITLGYLGGGARLWVKQLFFSASLGKLTFKDVATGEVEKNIESEERAYELGIGYRIKVTQLMGLIISGHALNSTLHPENGDGFDSEYRIWNYRASIALNFVLPSIPSVPE